jgi:hypothetical protein
MRAGTAKVLEGRERRPDWRRGVALMTVVCSAVDEGSRVVHLPPQWLEAMAPLPSCACNQRRARDVYRTETAGCALGSSTVASIRFHSHRGD